MEERAYPMTSQGRQEEQRQVISLVSGLIGTESNTVLVGKLIPIKKDYLGNCNRDSQMVLGYLW